jgi:rhamnulokinase
MHEDLLRRPRVFGEAKYFLTMADYFNFLLGGCACVEESLASTTQMCDVRTRRWADGLIAQVGLPRGVFPDLVSSCTVTGGLPQAVRDEIGIGEMKVVATCSHDTGAAVAAVPAKPGDNWAYLSSGTWSLLGVELEKPCITRESFEAGFTNELGYGGSVRFLKNIVGLWIVQECRRYWAREGSGLDYGKMMDLASPHMGEDSLIRPDDARFYAPGRMPEKIAEFCKETAQRVPQSPGAVVACVLRSLACLYAEVLESLEKITGRSISHLHVVGGGSRNELLNQAAADMTGKIVHAGPAEATAIGNLLLQSLALGHIGSIEELRRIVCSSADIKKYVPNARAEADKLMEKFSMLKKRSA